MNYRKLFFSSLCGLSLFNCIQLNAEIVGGSVTGGSSFSNGGAFFKLTPPLTKQPSGDPTGGSTNSVGFDNFNDDNLYAFDEGQNIELSSSLSVDILASTGMSGSISSGSIVASHYLIYDPSTTRSIEGCVDFDADIFAVITSSSNMNASDMNLANDDVNYVSTSLRGLESGDSVSFPDADTVCINFTASSPGDYIRVITDFSPNAADPDQDGIFTEFEDLNGNGNPDDDDTDEDGTPDYLDNDDDGDGLLTSNEAPDANEDNDPSDARNSDNDSLADYLDADDDNDGVLTNLEGADPDEDGDPTDALRTDSDDLPDYLDTDSDNDNLEDGAEDANQNGIRDLVETDARDADTDNDEINDDIDNCPLEANSDQLNNDGDTDGDLCDADDDNDLIPDDTDNCPFTANFDQADDDSNSIGNACDTNDVSCFPITTKSKSVSLICL